MVNIHNFPHPFLELTSRFCYHIYGMVMLNILRRNSLDSTISYSLQIFRRPGRSSPIHRLPHELLSYIFALSIRIDARNDIIRIPIILSHVCMHWRAVALSTTRLWTNVILTYPCSRYQIERTASWLIRSRKMPLDILLDFRNPSWDWDEDSHNFRWKNMETIIRLLLPHVARWQHFDLLTDTWAPIFTFLWYTRRVQSAPALQSLSISRCNAYFASKGEIFQPVALKKPIAWFAEGFGLQNLRKISLVGVHVDWSKSGMSDLIELELKYHASDVMPTVGQFATILSASPNLERLSIIGWGPQFSFPAAKYTETQDTARPAMEQTDFRLPHLKSFALGFVDVDYAVRLLSLFSFPALEELSLEDVSAGLSVVDPQDASPILEFIVADQKKYRRSLHPSTTSLPLSNIRSIHFHTIYASKEAFSHFLDTCIALERLSLTNTCPTILHALSSFPKDLEPRYPCPFLTELICKNVDYDTLLGTVASRARSQPLKIAQLDVSDASSPVSDAQLRSLIRAGIKVVADDSSDFEFDGEAGSLSGATRIGA